VAVDRADDDVPDAPVDAALGLAEAPAVLVTALLLDVLSEPFEPHAVRTRTVPQIAITRADRLTMTPCLLPVSTSDDRETHLTGEASHRERAHAH
jgi:hypothetical protein